MASLAPTPAVIDMGRLSTPVPQNRTGTYGCPSICVRGNLFRGTFADGTESAAHAVGLHPKAGPNFAAMSVRICT